MMQTVLVIGGAQGLGQQLALRLLEEGFDVTILDRRIERDDLPEAVHKLQADRSDPQQLKRALLARSFELVVDFTASGGGEAAAIIDLLQHSIAHYIFISTGQVYLVREQIERPFSEDDYDNGRLLPQPKPFSFAYAEWRHGINKREVEDTLVQAHAETGFPYTTLRLPMVNSENDQFHRLYNYILRVQDGGPILVPQTPTYPLRNVYSGDVIDAIVHLLKTGRGKGRALNISQDETVTIAEFVGLLADILGTQPQIVMFPRSELEAAGFLPDCSPYSDRWMSELTNEASKALGITYTPLPEYLRMLVDYYLTARPPVPISYRRRAAERQFALSHISGHISGHISE